MATQRGQRIGIWIIAIVLTVGTIGSFIVIILSNSNQKIDAQQATAQQAAAQAEQLKAAQANADNSVPFGGYSASAFDPASITSLSVQTLVEGTNQVIQGWSQGLTGVKVGSVVQINIPANLAYGATGSGIIPAGAPLEFIVQIHSIDNSASSSGQ